LAPKRDTESSRPTHVVVTSIDDPPALTNGSGLPVTGINPVTAAMFMNACRPIIAVSPPATIRPN
jgi:hypothetical protein